MARAGVVAGAVRAACGKVVGAICGAARAAIGLFEDAAQPAAAAVAAVARGAADAFEPLESRQLLSAAWLDNGILKVTGNRNQRNTLSVTVSGSNYVARANGVTKYFAASSVKSVKLVGANWNDTISVSGSITRPADLQGWAGNDTISGGSGNDAITGGDGNDSLRGNGGNDTINGDGGNDVVDGGSGTDRLSGGTGSNTIRSGEISGGAVQGSSGSSSSVSVTSLQLWNSSNNTLIKTLSGGETIDLAKTPRVTIVAQTGSSVQSVRFALDSSSWYRVESSKPYAIAGDFTGDLADWNVPTGSHKVTVTPYSRTGAAGTAGSARTIYFTVTRSATTSGGNSGSSGGGTTSSGGIVPRDNSASAPDAVITAVSSLTIHAGQSIDVQATSSALHDGTPLTARYLWDFGDAGSKYNVLEGFNASHFYANPGTYTVKLTLTNEAGKTDVATRTVTVQSAGRKTIYVSNDGSDSNDGLSTSRPIRTWSKAITKMSDNVQILFNGGDTFSASQTMNIHDHNVVIGSYGSGKATIKWTGATNHDSIIYLGRDFGGGENTVRDLVFDSIYTGTVSDGRPQGVAIGSGGDTILNNTFLNLDYAITTAPGPNGLLVQGNDAPMKTGLKEYFVWSEGADISILGNHAVNTIHGHIVRSGGTDRLLIVDNDFSNPNDQYAGDPTTRGTLTIHQGNYVYVRGNRLTDGKVNFGPLPYATNDKGARQNWNVFEDNIVRSELFLDPGAQHTMVRNNVMLVNNGTAMQIAGYSSTNARGVVDTTVANNTGINTGTGGEFLRVAGSSDGIALVNNLYLAPSLATGGNGAAVVSVYDNDLSSFTRISGNVWPAVSADRYAQGGIFYVWSYWSNQAGYKTLSEWDAYGVVSNEKVADVSYNSSTFAPSSSSVAASAATVWKGVFEDFNGRIRSASGSWTAGAVDV